MPAGNCSENAKHCNGNTKHCNAFQNHSNALEKHCNGNTKHCNGNTKHCNETGVGLLLQWFLGTCPCRSKIIKKSVIFFYFNNMTI